MLEYKFYPTKAQNWQNLHDDFLAQVGQPSKTLIKIKVYRNLSSNSLDTRCVNRFNVTKMKSFSIISTNKNGDLTQLPNQRLGNS